jgi:pyrimidine-specific ribonucleoside hydrolase
MISLFQPVRQEKDDPLLYIRISQKGFCEVAISAGLMLTFVLSGCLPFIKLSAPTFQPVVDTKVPSQTQNRPVADTKVPSQTQTQPVVNTKPPSKTQTQPVVFPLSGIWRGSAKNGTFEMQVIIIIQTSCQVGEACGTFDLNIPCSGIFTLIGEENDVYEFQAGNKKGSCGGAGRDFLQLLPNGTLQYTSRGDYGETLGNLVRNNPSTSSSPEIQRMPIIFDDDGSPDGMSALLYLLIHPAVDLRAVGISYGEAHPAIFIQHIGRMLDDFGFTDIPLGVGQAGSLSGSNGFPEWLRQSANNFWGFPIPNVNETYPVQDSADLIVSIIMQSPEPITLFFSGPFTNLARALRLDPEIRENISALYMMGGAVYIPGNIHDFYPDSDNTVADWNPYSDPQAAKEVFESGLEMYLVPLDATNQVLISKQDTHQWRAGGRISNFAADIYDSLMDSSGKNNFYIWDLMAAEIMLKPDLCGFQELHLEVVTVQGSTSGQTVVIPNGKPNINVCLEPNATLIKQTLVDVFSINQ